MCLRKLFGKKEVVEEVPVEKKPVDELLEMINALAEQLRLVVADDRAQDERVRFLEEEIQQEKSRTVDANKRIQELEEEKKQLEAKLDEINRIIDGE
jgi:cell fate (sporulation/competence/biofilm development) regulator YlbF (YheA/YmcA/DUF963 family)